MAKFGFGLLGRLLGRLLRFSTFVLSMAMISLGVAGCAPKDEKVSSRFNGASASATTDARFDDHVTEYSRSMLIELADVARQTEDVLRAVAVRDQAPPEVSGAPLPNPSSPAALRAASCKAVTSVPSPEGSLKLQTEIQACKEKGITFSGTQSGREVAYATFTKSAGSSGAGSSVATLIKVEGKGIETLLVPNANSKDALRVKSQRFFEAQLVSEESGTRLYRFSFENYGSYSLDLKAMTDVGSITSVISGVLVYDVAQSRVVAFRSLIEPDRMILKVESAREARSGGKVVRQEFFGSGIANGDLTIDLSNCALPTGAVKARFTVRPLVGDKKYIVDSSTLVQSSKDSVANFDKSKVAAAKVCTSEEQLTMTEFYSGLLY